MKAKTTCGFSPSSRNMAFCQRNKSFSEGKGAQSRYGVCKGLEAIASQICLAVPCTSGSCIMASWIMEAKGTT